MATAADGAGARMAAVVVDYEAADVLGPCVRSLRREGVATVVVVENGSAGAARAALDSVAPDVPLLVTGRNLGYGSGANRGLAASGDTELVLVCNPDLLVHPGALDVLAASLDTHPDWAIVGPRIVDSSGTVYPSARRFPSMVDAAGHALLALFKPDNRFTRRYRLTDAEGEEAVSVDWVSGACFLARRGVLESLGGFDEGYFMFAEDMDLCWRAERAGHRVGFEPAAVVTHAHGVSRRHHPYRMLLAHHRSALRFATQRAHGVEVLALPLAAAVLGARLVLAVAEQAMRRGRPDG